MFVVGSRVEEADLVLDAAIESQRRLHRLQGPASLFSQKSLGDSFFFSPNDNYLGTLELQ